MSTKPSPTGKKRLPRFLAVLLGLVALGCLLAGSGFAFAASQETHDPFCASCHTQPESTYVQRSTSAPQVDLASFHTAQKTRCIDCHSGTGLMGRMQAELLGARNAAKWYTHTAVQPAKLTYPIKDANCLKCHQAVVQQGFVPKQSVTIPGLRGRGGGEEEGRNNHWHEFLARWQATGGNTGSCVSCHIGHSTDGSTQTAFQNLQITNNICDACHKVLRREGEGGG